MSNTRQKKVRLLLALAVGLPALLLGILVLVFGLIQTPPGKALVSGVLSSQLSGRLDWQVSIEGISGIVPFAFQIEAIELADEAGPWLHVSDLSASLKVMPLLRGRVVLPALTAERITLQHLPAGKEKPPEEKAFKLPQIPRLPRWVAVESLETTLQLDEAIANTPATLTVDGSYVPAEAERLLITADVLRVDAPGTQVTLRATQAPGGLDITLDLSDTAILPGILEVAAPVKIALTGGGDADKWHGVLDAALGAQRLASAEVSLSGKENVAVTATATLSLDNALVPERVATQLGSDARLELSGSLATDGSFMLSPLLLTTPLAELRAEGSMLLSARSVELAVALRHNDLRLLAGQLGGQEPLPLILNAQLKGPPEQVSATLAGSVQNEELLSGEVLLDLVDGLAASGRITVPPHPPLLPPDIARWLDDGASADFKLAYSPDGVLVVDRAVVETALAQLTVSGSFGIATPGADGQLALEVAALGAVGDILGTPLTGQTTLALALDGDDSSTGVRGTMTLHDASYETLHIGQATLDIAGTLGVWPRQLAQAPDVTLQGQFSDFLLEGTSLGDGALEAHIALPEAEHLVVHAFEFHDGNLKASAAGEIWFQEPGADFDVQLTAAALTPYQTLLGQPLSGGVSLEANVERDAAGITRAQIGGAWTQPGGLPEPLPALLHPEATISATVQIAGKQAQVEQLEIRSPQGALTGTAEYGLETRVVTADARLEIEDLAAAGEALGQELGGTLDADVHLSGPTDNFEVTADVRAAALQLPQFQAEQVALKASVEGLPKSPAGTLDADLIVAGKPLALDTTFDVDWPQVTLSALELVSDANQIRGQLALNSEAQTGSGTLTLELRDLEQLGAMFNVDSDGAVLGELRLAESPDGLLIAADLNAEGLAYGSIALERADVTLAVTDPFGELALRADVNAENLQLATARFEQLTLGAAGDRTALDLTLDTHGTYKDAVPVSSELQTHLAIDEKTATVRRFEGRIDEYPYKLTHAFNVAYGVDGIQISSATLEVEGGAITVQGGMDSETANFEAEWTTFPVALAEAFGAPPLRGESGGRIQITGPVAAPNVEVSATVVQFRYALAPPEFPGIELTAHATAAAGTVSAELTADSPDTVGATANLRFPLMLSLAPFAFDLPAEGTLTGQLEGNTQLAAIPQLMGLEEHVVNGELTAEFALRGTLTDPLLTGNAIVENGRYENAESGTILEAVYIALRAEGRTLYIERFDATDGGAGKIDAAGRITLEPEDGFPLEARLTVAQAHLVRRDDISATASGELELSGSVADMLVVGHVDVGPANIVIPERLPAEELTVVEVTEINDPEGPLDETEQAKLEEELQEAGGPTIRLNIQLRSDGRVFVRGPGLDSEWRGDLQLGGTAGDPRLAGSLLVIRGTLSFLGKRFELAESTLTFDADSPPSPYLNVLAVHEARDLVARLRLTGEFSSLDLDISSEPPLPQDEILAQVLFGRNLSEISPVQALQLARYAAVFSGRVKGLRLLGGPTELPGIDRLDIKSGANLLETTVGFGKYLSDNVYVEVEQGIGPESSRATVEIELTPELSVEAAAGANRHNSVGLFWKKDY